MWWPIGCTVSRVNTCIRNYLLCDLVVMSIVLSCVSGCNHNYLLCDLVVVLIALLTCRIHNYLLNYLLCDVVIMLIEWWRCYSLTSSGFFLSLSIDCCIYSWLLYHGVLYILCLCHTRPMYGIVFDIVYLSLCIVY